jgi:hypothetical protein
VFFKKMEEVKVLVLVPVSCFIRDRREKTGALGLIVSGV